MSPSAGTPEPVDFDSRCLAGGTRLHVRRTSRFKSVWIDVLLPQLMQPVAATRLALLSRLLERGTRRLPDLRALNRYTDWLYGAAFSAQTGAFGPFQLLHLHYDAVDDAFLPQEGEDLLACGLRLLGEVLTEPFLEGGILPISRVEQEKASLRRYVEGLDNDRSLLAQRRCMEHLGAGSPWALAPHGDPRELKDVGGADVLTFLSTFVSTAPMDVYVCGDVDVDQVAELCTAMLPGATGSRRPVDPVPHLQPVTAPRRLCEYGEVSQGRLMLGFRTPLRLGDDEGEYAALVLLNLLFGGDAHSRLHSRVREEEGLCYHIASYLEPMAGLLFVEAGVEACDRQTVVDHILDELHDLATHGPTVPEIERSRALARQRLDSAEDSRDSLVRFHHARRLANSAGTRGQLYRALGSVTPAALRALAKDIRLDTEYYLAPTEPAPS